MIIESIKTKKQTEISIETWELMKREHRNFGFRVVDSSELKDKDKATAQEITELIKFGKKTPIVTEVSLKDETKVNKNTEPVTQDEIAVQTDDSKRKYTKKTK